ncbi:hypothetical protein KY290_037682 [Solanum tuberosum]|uniref:C2H2-type domain-containing protein n=1 Tax=Solanum tuberosum TaxID=4113 RepID=A0ABQ7TXZ7_SOLTU|nr:hypothetical protein KY290_037682 [Solanum tuberosum]
MSSSNPRLFLCHICYRIIFTYHEFMIHVQSHPIQLQPQVHISEGSNRLNLTPLSILALPTQNARLLRNDRHVLPQETPSYNRWLQPHPHIAERSNRPNSTSQSRLAILAQNTRIMRNERHVSREPSSYHRRPVWPMHVTRGAQTLMSTRSNQVRVSNSTDTNLTGISPESITRPFIDQLDVPIQHIPHDDNENNGLDLTLKL